MVNVITWIQRAALR